MVENDTHAVFEKWAVFWEKRYGRKPFLNWGRDSRLSKELLKQLTKQEIEAALERYFEDDSEFTSRSGHSFQCFYSQVNRYLGESESGASRG